ncbi:MAG TPA: ATP-binding protein [Acidimicrobiales bacterium]|nr:ATP-binding protein [Acidimicrobiales bacterium]
MRLRTLLPKGGMLPDDVWRNRHRGILALLWAHVPALFVFALYRGETAEHSLTEAAIVAVPATAAYLCDRWRRMSTVIASVGLMVASAVLVHLSGGMIEAHFHFFVMVGVVVLYQDWRPFLVAVGFVVLHHGAIGVLLPQDVYNHPGAWDDPWSWALVHGAGIVGMSLAGIANWKINERSQAELSTMAAMLKATLESTADGILVVDPAGAITSTNGRFGEMWHLPADLIARGDGQEALSFVLDQLDDPEAFLSKVQELYAHPDAESHDTLHFKDGRVFERSSKPQRVDGAVVGRVWSFHDVTDRRRLEAELGHALEKALDSSRLKSDFMATMSHEIRTPMNGVIGLTGLLLDTELSDDQREYADGVRASGEALLGIINDILDFSKIEAGKLELESVDFDLSRALHEVTSLVAASARAKGLAVTAEFSPDAPRWLSGDVGRLRQVVLNLVSNAVKFTAEGGVVIRVRPSSKVAANGLQGVRLEVEDTGVGIAEADRHRLFEPFSQADASTTRRYGGTGLGLAICSRLVAEMGGTMGVQDRPGGGTVFWVEMPFAASTPTPKAQLVTDESGDGDEPVSGCLLVVEDNVINQLVAKEIVRSLGYTCEVAANGAEALDALAIRDYAAVLMDCYMPEMDGFEATRELRRREGATRHTPIIAMTAGAMAEDRERCDAVGMDDYVSKPVDAKHLASVLRRWVAAEEEAVVRAG